MKPNLMLMMVVSIVTVCIAMACPFVNESLPTNTAEITDQKKASSSFSMAPKFRHSSLGSLPVPEGRHYDFLNISAHWIEQPLDHFNKDDNRTLRQRYWKLDSFKKTDGPIFLMIGGNSPADVTWIQNPNITYLRWAKTIGAVVYMLEHRYYGHSQPEDLEDLSTANLKYLSSRQALEDIANFIESINQENLNKSEELPKWILFGGSYAGTLAAWFRQLYPQLTTGAVASSAPVFFKLNFFEYFQVVDRAYRIHDPECAKGIEAAFKKVRRSLATKNDRQTLDNLLKPTLLLNMSYPKDIQTFFISLIDVFERLVLHEATSINKYSLQYRMDELCTIMTNKTDPVWNLRSAMVYMNGVEGVDNCYQSRIDAFQNISFDSDSASARGWLWQTCTEFGLFQSTDVGGSVFGNIVPLDFYIELCMDVFGPEYDRLFINKAVEKTRNFYKSGNFESASHLILPNGSNDPWHALGFYTSNKDPSGITSILMNGTTHCSDMYPSRCEDARLGLDETRERIFDLISVWLN